MKTTPSHLARFEQTQVWQNGYEDDPAWREKHRVMEAMLPEEVRSVLDLGCGEGSQALLLASTYRVVGADASGAALRRVTVPSVRAWSQSLPFASQSFDVVWASELLEHLPDEALAPTVAEMQRVAGSWLMISVPFREHLRLRQSRCTTCGGRFHIYGHVQRFDVSRLRREMDPYSLRSWAFCGPPEKRYHPVLLRIRQLLGGKWFCYPPAHPVCPHCGSSEQDVGHGNRIARWCDRLDQSLQTSSVGLARPRWLVTLWEGPGLA
jgi:SAM-dependent methyltransferase